MVFPEAPPTGRILRTDVPNLSAVFADKAHANAQEFLPGLTFEQLMRQAMGKFDRIVVDSAPVNLVSDTLLYARHVQSVCLVIQRRQNSGRRCHSCCAAAFRSRRGAGWFCLESVKEYKTVLLR